MLFSGVNNSITLNREYYQEYACQFDLRYFPFDTQVCCLTFELFAWEQILLPTKKCCKIKTTFLKLVRSQQKVANLTWGTFHLTHRYGVWHLNYLLENKSESHFQMCAMVFQVQGMTDDYVNLAQDGDGIDFLGEITFCETSKNNCQPQPAFQVVATSSITTFRWRSSYCVPSMAWARGSSRSCSGAAFI